MCWHPHVSSISKAHDYNSIPNTIKSGLNFNLGKKNPWCIINVSKQYLLGICSSLKFMVSCLYHHHTDQGPVESIWNINWGSGMCLVNLLNTNIRYKLVLAESCNISDHLWLYLRSQV